ncbi:unnamed protein product [Rotaria magnacalcarata]|uniref:NAD(P)(+)--arginine ADP-ribosyltransferase n=3 Tax=Rotaria magnacalcarata TaxID=392030 RepID=A0A816R8W9_9BILA|nr:unnamed protein product [Rotaria magnacalcarata]
MASSSFHEKPSALRFTDVGELPKRMLAPIEGYDTVPLVSLEDAVKPLVDIVPNVERNVYVVKENCQDPEDGLTTDESASIMLYTYESILHENSLYVKLNDTLRSEQRKHLVPWFLYLRLILTALARLPSKRRSIFRGVKKELWLDYPEGKVFIWWGFSSCTSTIGVLENEHFFGKTGERNLFQINCTTAKDIKKHSFIVNEDEILLLPARQFEFDLLQPVAIPNLTVQSKISSQGKSPPISGAMGAQFAATQAKSKFYIPANAEWTQNGVTIAGSHGQGDATNKLYWSHGLFVDDDQTVVVADFGNDRIIQWKKDDTTNGQVIAGGKYVLVDKETDTLIICYRQNQRVVRWSRCSGTTQGEILIGNIACYGLAMNEQRYLYVSDTKKHEVRLYQLGGKNYTVVAGGNGQGDGLNQLNFPAYLFVDRQQNVYVSDWNNHRVMKWTIDAKEGIVVAGGQGVGNAWTQLYYPNGLFVDALSTLYVADSWNHRVMRWTQGAKKGTVIVGENGRGEGANQFDIPIGLSFDRYFNLYVTDYNNNRVKRFSIE